MKKALLAGILAMMWLLPLGAFARTDLRGWSPEQKYQYVQVGRYPYEKDGAAAPVLWRVLEAKEGQALLLTEYVIDASQVIFETDQRVIEQRTYRRIDRYDESDLYTHLNTRVIDDLFGDDPVRNALMEEPGGGKLFILTTEQFLREDYGFYPSPWGESASRKAVATPYAHARGVYVDGGNGKSSYWVATLKAPGVDYRMQLAGYDGHLSYGAFTRVNVGLRLSVRLDLSRIEIAGGSGTKDDPLILRGREGAPETPAAAETTAAPAAAEETPIPTQEARPEPAPTIPPEPEETPEPALSPEPEQAGVTVSFVGDCSVGDAIQFKGSTPSYHKTIDEKGYDWPFSLVQDYFARDDLTVANLEVVFTTRKNHQDKRYPLIADPDHVQILQAAGIDLVNTVNNHCMDFYREGYQDSLKILDEAGILRFGSVYYKTKNGFDDLAVVDVEGIRLGFVGLSYPQNDDQSGIAARIKKLKEQEGCDVVVVSLHWGRETHMTPETWQLAYARKVIDAGADLIWGHHPHVIQPIHIYKGQPILYSTGNFTFGTMSKVDPSTGIFQAVWQKDEAGNTELKTLRVIPCQTQGSGDYRPYELTDPEARRAVLKKLTFSKTHTHFENPPASFLETGEIQFENGQMVP